MYAFYLALLSVTVTIHASCTYPTPKNPKEYALITCSGVFVSPNEILTAGHCVSRSRGNQWIKTSDNKSFSVIIQKLDKQTDLALLKVTKPLNHPYVLLGKPLKITDAVYTVNSGADYEGTFNSGFVCNVILDDYKILTLLHNAPLVGGASGSGLFNAKKELIGINVATMKNLSEAVDIYEIQKFLNRR